MLLCNCMWNITTAFYKHSSLNIPGRSTFQLVGSCWRIQSPGWKWSSSSYWSAHNSSCNSFKFWSCIIWIWYCVAKNGCASLISGTVSFRQIYCWSRKLSRYIILEIGWYKLSFIFSAKHHTYMPTKIWLWSCRKDWKCDRLGKASRIRTNISRPSRGSSAHHIQQQMHANVSTIRAKRGEHFFS